MVRKVLRVRQARKARLVHREQSGRLALKVQQVLRVPLERKVLRVRKVLLVHKAHRAAPALKVSKALREPLDRKV